MKEQDFANKYFRPRCKTGKVFANSMEAKASTDLHWEEMDRPTYFRLVQSSKASPTVEMKPWFSKLRKPLKKPGVESCLIICFLPVGKHLFLEERFGNTFLCLFTVIPLYSLCFLSNFLGLWKIFNIEQNRD